MLWTGQPVVRKAYQNTDIDSARGRYHLFMDAAVALARKSHLLQKHGCVIVYKNSIISSAVNTEHCGSCSAHAEINAINKIKHRRKIMSLCKMYVARVGTPSMGYCTKYSRPCEECSKRIAACGIGKVYYTTHHEFNRRVSATQSRICSEVSDPLPRTVPSCE